MRSRWNFEPYRSLAKIGGICWRTMPGPLSVTVTRKRVAWLAGGGDAPLLGATSTMTATSGRMPASSHASSALSTASLTQVRSALRGLSKPSRWRFLVKNSETEISRWRAPISAAETAGFGPAVEDTAAFGAAVGDLASTVAISSLIPDPCSRFLLYSRSQGDDYDEPTHTTDRGRCARPDVGSFHGRARRRGAGGADDLGASLQPGADPLRARRDGGPHHAVHAALRAPRRAGEADAGERQDAQSGRVVELVARRARLRVRAAQGSDLPQRRARHGRGRQVLVRAVPRHLREGAQGEGRRGRDAGSPTRPLPAQAAVAGLHGVLRHTGDGRGLDRPQEVRRESG